MTKVKFELADSNSLKIQGSSFDLNSLKTLNDILQKITKENKIKKINLIGNFNTELEFNCIFDNSSMIDESLSSLHSITQTIKKSNIIFTSHVNGIMRGPALELALSCNFIKAVSNTLLDFSFTNKNQIPFFGTVQRIIKILGYKKTLQVLLSNDKLSTKCLAPYVRRFLA